MSDHHSEALAERSVPAWKLCPVLERRELGPDVVLLWLEAPGAARLGQPGQFVHLAVPSAGSDPLLRRPISIAALDPRRGRLGLIIRAVGRGTAKIIAAQPGDQLDVLGPLGAGFPQTSDGKSLIVGGGIGTAPLFALALSMVEGQSEHAAQTKALMLVGARNREELWAAGLAAELGIPALFATDDGSVGHPGFVTDLLRTELTAGKTSSVYACGPTPMLRRVKELAEAANVNCYVSLEQRMACGVGACFGCSWPRSDEAGGAYARVCRDGPVFASREVLI